MWKSPPATHRGRRRASWAGRLITLARDNECYGNNQLTEMESQDETVWQQ